MTARHIKQILGRNRRAGRWPSSLFQIAQDKGVHRSEMTKALKHPRQRPGTRAYLEAAVRRGHPLTRAVVDLVRRAA